MKSNNLKKISELNKGDLFVFGSQKSINVFTSTYDDIISDEFKYNDNMGFEMITNDNIYVKLVDNTEFTDCDEFAAYAQDSLLGFGDIVTAEFNSYTGLSLPIGANVYQIEDLPNTGKNYAQFGTVKAWLYDLYEMHKTQDLSTIEIF